MRLYDRRIRSVSQHLDRSSKANRRAIQRAPGVVQPLIAPLLDLQHAIASEHAFMFAMSLAPDTHRAVVLLWATVNRNTFLLHAALLI